MNDAGQHPELPQLDRRLTTPPTERWGRRLTRSRVAPALVAAALGSVLVAAPVAAQVVDDSTTSTTDTSTPDQSTTTTEAPADTTTTAVDPFDAGTAVTTVEGDSATTAAVDLKKPGHVKDVQGDGVNVPAGTGGISLIDGHGLEYFVNTDIGFSTTSSASAAMSEASYTTSITATTSAGGTTMSTLNDAFDGYNTLCVDLGNGSGNCDTGTTGGHIYNQLGSPPGIDCSGRNLIFPVQNIVNGPTDLDVQRQVYVPAGGDFARWLNTVHNNGASPITFRLAIANNLGSDSNTIITGSSAGGAINTGVTWVGSMQNYSGSTSSDPRLGHVLQGSGGAVGLNELNFVNGDDNPYWSYSLTLAPGETQTIANFVAGAGSKATANAVAAGLAAGGASGQWGCMTPDEQAQVANFVMVAPPTSTTTTATPTTEAPTTSVAAAAETGTLPYTGAGGEIIPLAAAGAAVAGAGGAAVAGARRRLRRPRFRHGR